MTILYIAMAVVGVGTVIAVGGITDGTRAGDRLAVIILSVGMTLITILAITDAVLPRTA